MKNVFVLTCFVATLALAACGSGDTPAYDNSLSSSTEIKSAAKDSTFSDSMASTLNLAPKDAAGVAPVTPTITQTSSPQPITTVASKTAGKAAAGMNPAHGEPGHRCDIAVGAPLSSPVQTTTTPAVTSPTISSTPAVAKPSPVTSALPSATGQKSAIATGNTGKLNPPHGQPGHDCAVQVGAPLKN